ncbi:uncharacterized protein P174DRAFT_437296 [Aspergillus novofumigatus IBT 16806]|uniref:Uncharacterized protein n=1 Tax=Aspergillus novofumigatus (strain IBT 16806) TaxID=1392255 RepID=A0A2I1CMP4_ASPN1|nr:uncharacterized protein P174DRAFT_437296 [Aspergillus novofumigatus IBT 16806]PKX98865.1 hypothetical protein P174DRAFT_437296 [Aspergillus novofumigatus IBT 16806]
MRAFGFQWSQKSEICMFWYIRNPGILSLYNPRSSAPGLLDDREPDEARIRSTAHNCSKR